MRTKVVNIIILVHFSTPEHFRTLYKVIASFSKMVGKTPQYGRIHRILENNLFLQVFWFLAQKFRKRNCQFNCIIKLPKVVVFENMFFVHIGRLFMYLRMTEYIEYVQVFHFFLYFFFLEQKFCKGKCKFINYVYSLELWEIKNILVITLDLFLYPSG